MAFRDLAGPTWADRWAAPRAPAMRGRWRPIRHGRSYGGFDRRPPPPSRRASRARMRPAAFLVMVASWAVVVASLLAAALVIRLG